MHRVICLIYAWGKRVGAQLTMKRRAHRGSGLLMPLGHFFDSKFDHAPNLTIRDD
jgi:hypothetical protein